MLLVKIAKYIVFCVYRRSYLIWSPVCSGSRHGDVALSVQKIYSDGRVHVLSATTAKRFATYRKALLLIIIFECSCSPGREVPWPAAKALAFVPATAHKRIRQNGTMAKSKNIGSP